VRGSKNDEEEEEHMVAKLSEDSKHEVAVYTAIGEFIFWFSQLEFTIKARLAGALDLPEGLFDCIIGPYDFRILCAVTEKVLSLKAPKAQAKIHKYFSRCIQLNDKSRIVVAHGSWTTGGARHMSRGSLQASIHFSDEAQPVSNVDIQKIIKETAKAKELMQELFTLGAIDNPRSLTESEGRS
jgi:hypothetical protein